MNYKRCIKQWYWHWRKGLVPKAVSFGALDLGTWMHMALAHWYAPGIKRRGELPDLFEQAAYLHIRIAESNNAPEYQLEKADELLMLGKAVAAAYEKHYRNDYVDVLSAEIPLEFEIANDSDLVIAVHRLKPDLVYRDRDERVWLMEHKTAASIRTEHLIIDDQARPYGAMAELALIKRGVLKPNERLYGIMYNFMRKALPDEREQGADGRYLNKNGTVSKRQPSVQFVRHPVRMGNRAKAVTLRRVQRETIEITTITKALRDGLLDPALLRKTPHRSCPKFCDYFQMCTLEEEGVDIRQVEKNMFVRRDPYIYDEDSTDEVATFEMG